MNFIDEIIKELDELERKNLSENATPNSAGIRRRKENELDIRPAFLRDADRILHSFAFSRYIDKTQVFYNIKKDFISHRVLHVQWVSKISRFCARVLSLNEDLVEAISLGHDIGHPPRSHVGEEILTNICLKHDIGQFHHNGNSIRFLDKLEKRDFSDKKAIGLNLTLQVMDGILCHDGERHEKKIIPDKNKDFYKFDSQLNDLFGGKRPKLIPMTLEGCLVRFVDSIAYVGRDFEDAIYLNIINRNDLPNTVINKLGTTNREIIHNLVMDLIKNSKNQNYISYSNEIANALAEFKNFNYENIYNNPINTEDREQFEKKMSYIFDYFIKNIKNNERNSKIFTDHVNLIGNDYLITNNPAVIVRDYISGMTDAYFLKIANQVLKKPNLNSMK
ncbi:MAG: HD domain-containing protein [Candidatus Lokiarchaeota archaeon]|nr:HD domain-containing protein [Candidatus Lokiarchaeota archaeon]